MIKCPYCGKSYYKIRYSTTTVMYYPPIYKDGINVNPDRNITTHTCECMECNKEFTYEERMGEIINEQMRML